jgi:outer membrane lipoprotein-sorting protein
MTSPPELRANEPEAFEVPPPGMVALPATAPSIDELFDFMRDAERRFRTLRMRIVEQANTAHGPVETSIELWLAHPGRAKVITNRPARGGRPASYTLWVSDGRRIRTYDSEANISTDRAHRHVPEGIDDASLPASSRVVPPVTELPAETLPDAFVHPAGLTRNLATGRVVLFGQARIAGREALLLEVDAPRATLIETDRPDHIEVLGVDRETGMVTLLEDRVGESVTRHAEATYLEPDARIRDEDFVIHVPEDATPIF